MQQEKTTAGPGSRRLSCYYFHGQDFCLVPRHVREDVQWMADHGVDSVAVGVHEGDLMGSNLPLVCEEVRRAGMEVLVIPSRVAGLTAGWHRAPGFLAAMCPETWARQADGAPVLSAGLGPQCSVYHPAVFEAVCRYLDAVLEQLPVSGIIWDELKCLEIEDHSPAAVEALSRPSRGEAQLRASCDLFGRLNQHLRRRAPEVRVDLFIQAHQVDAVVQQAAGIDGLDAFGCDGKCWPADACDRGEGGAVKHLLGNVERFQAAGAAHRRALLVLIETQMLDAPALDLTLEHLPACLAYDIDHLIYYYYPRLMQNPEHYMPRIGRTLAAWRRGSGANAAVPQNVR